METLQTTGHRMKANHSNALPRYLVCVDTETKRMQTDELARHFSHTLRCGVAMYSRLRGTDFDEPKVKTFQHTDTFWRWFRSLLRPNYTVWIVAHNVLFDLRVLGFTHELENVLDVRDSPRSKRHKDPFDPENPHRLAICVLDSPPTIVGMRNVKTDGRWIALDTLNWFRLPLSDIGKSLGLPKLSIDFDACTTPELLAYCTRDCEIVFSAMKNLITFVREERLGMFSYTVASQAMHAYRHRFGTSAIFYHDNQEIKQLERKSYFGGRTECFRIGKIEGDAWHYDINGLYPSVMRDNEYPIKLIRCEKRDHFLDLEPAIDWKRSIAEVELWTDRSLYPLRNGPVAIYPVGKFRTVLAGPELKIAHDAGEIMRIRSWAEYETAPIFTYWVDELWKLRNRYKAEGNEAWELLVKNLMNSLFGKFGQLSPAWIERPDILPDLPLWTWIETEQSTGKRVKFRSIGWQVQQEVERKESANTLVAIPAFVTAYARLRMNYLRWVAGNNATYYQGVDSLIVGREGKERLEAAGELSDTTLGKLRLDLWSDDAEVLGCMDYRIGSKVITAGMARRGEYDAEGRFLQRLFSAPSDLFVGSGVAHVEETMVEFRKTPRYTKGIRQPDGWVAPLALELPLTDSPLEGKLASTAAEANAETSSS